MLIVQSITNASKVSSMPPKTFLITLFLASARFWFTDLTAVSPDEPVRILEKIFLTPKDFEAGILHGFGD
jgi:hypothetical protein